MTISSFETVNRDTLHALFAVDVPIQIRTAKISDNTEYVNSCVLCTDNAEYEVGWIEHPMTDIDDIFSLVIHTRDRGSCTSAFSDTKKCDVQVYKLTLSDIILIRDSFLLTDCEHPYEEDRYLTVDVGLALKGTCGELLIIQLHQYYPPLSVHHQWRQIEALASEWENLLANRSEDDGEIFSIQVVSINRELMSIKLGSLLRSI